MADANTDVRETLDRFFRAVESRELDRIAPFFEEDAQMFSPLGTYAARLDGRAAIMEQFGAIQVSAVQPIPRPRPVPVWLMVAGAVVLVAVVAAVVVMLAKR